MIRSLPLAFLAVLAACGPDVRIPVTPAPPEARIGIGFRTLEVLDIALPTYAQLEEISVQEEDGTIVARGGLLWADDPTRAATLELVRALGTITNARVAGEPWPYDSYPDARLEVRLEEFVASRTGESTGEFRVSGQYFVASLDGSERDRARSFRLTVPLAPDASVGAVAAARGEAMTQLAAEIASSGLR